MDVLLFLFLQLFGGVGGSEPAAPVTASYAVDDSEDPLDDGIRRPKCGMGNPACKPE